MRSVEISFEIFTFSALLLLSLSSNAQKSFSIILKEGYLLDSIQHINSTNYSFDEDLALLCYQTFNDYLEYDSLYIGRISHHDEFENQLLSNATLNLTIGKSLSEEMDLRSLDHLSKAFEIFKEKKDTLGLIMSLRIIDKIYYSYPDFTAYLDNEDLHLPHRQILRLSKTSRNPIFQVINAEFKFCYFDEKCVPLKPDEITYIEQDLINELNDFPEFYFLKQVLFSRLGYYYSILNDHKKDLEAALTRIKYCHPKLIDECLSHILNASNSSNNLDTSYRYLKLYAKDLKHAGYRKKYAYYYQYSNYQAKIGNSDAAYYYLVKAENLRREQKRKQTLEGKATVRTHFLNQLFEIEIAKKRKEFDSKIRNFGIICLILFTLLIVFGFVYFRFHRLKKRTELLQLKRHMSGVLSHDIRSPLLSVIAKIELVEKRNDSNALKSLDLLSIKKALIDMKSFCNETIEFIKKEQKIETMKSYDSKAFIESFLLEYSAFLELSSVNVSKDLKSIDLLLNKKQTVSIKTILRNILSNLIKHQSIKNLIISNKLESQRFQISLTATNISFSQEELDFLNTKLTSNHKVVGGYGIILIKNFKKNLKHFEIRYFNEKNDAVVELSWKI